MEFSNRKSRYCALKYYLLERSTIHYIGKVSSKGSTSLCQTTHMMKHIYLIKSKMKHENLLHQRHWKPWRVSNLSVVFPVIYFLFGLPFLFFSPLSIQFFFFPQFTSSVFAETINRDFLRRLLRGMSSNIIHPNRFLSLIFFSPGKKLNPNSPWTGWTVWIKDFG